jgi:hypothetical protein
VSQGGKSLPYTVLYNQGGAATQVTAAQSECDLAAMVGGTSQLGAVIPVPKRNGCPTLLKESYQGLKSQPDNTVVISVAPNPQVFSCGRITSVSVSGSVLTVSLSLDPEDDFNLQAQEQAGCALSYVLAVPSSALPKQLITVNLIETPNDAARAGDSRWSSRIDQFQAANPWTPHAFLDLRQPLETIPDPSVRMSQALAVSSFAYGDINKRFDQMAPQVVGISAVRLNPSTLGCSQTGPSAATEVDGYILQLAYTWNGAKMRLAQYNSGSGRTFYCSNIQ